MADSDSQKIANCLGRYMIIMNRFVPPELTLSFAIRNCVALPSQTPIIVYTGSPRATSSRWLHILRLLSRRLEMYIRNRNRLCSRVSIDNTTRKRTNVIDVQRQFRLLTWVMPVPRWSWSFPVSLYLQERARRRGCYHQTYSWVHWRLVSTQPTCLDIRARHRLPKQ